MLKFAVKIFLFLMPLLVLFPIVEYRAREIPNNFEVKRQKLEQNLDRAEIIVAGPSHAFYGVKPKLLERPAVSTAYPAQDLYYDTRILLKYLPRAARVKLVVVTIAYISFEYRMEDGPYDWQAGFYKKAWGIPRLGSIPKIEDYSATALFGFQRSRDFLLTGKVSDMKKIDESGGNDDLQEANDFNVKNSQTTIELHNSIVKEKYFNQNVKYLDELLDALKEKNIRAVIITTPCYPSYYNNINAEKYRRMQNEINALSEKYDLNYYNYFRDERFTVEDFFDSDHLSTKGGEKFTRILNDEVIKKYFPAS